ncbi:hypothetical protein AB0G73_10570 [Streptomyces sp. NPDC020719]|uniref:hypothetical protein n=1 Tax=Streptomyces sp. NPDC020719 TaxID=3154896 RepID=UPI0033C04C81
MRIHRTPRRAGFTVLPNHVLQDRSLSFTARGIAGYLLSLPDGAQINVRKLADENPVVGRKGIEGAVRELIEQRYYFRRTQRDEKGQLRTETYFFDTPQSGDHPLPALPGVGEPGPDAPGTPPSGVKNSAKNGRKTPPRPPVDASAPPVTVAAGEGRSGEQTTEAARILRRLAAFDSRLKLSEGHVAKLAPEVTDWLDRGATIAEITDAATQGLPPKIYSAARLIADRLDRKRPARKRQWKTYADCKAGCGGLLPDGQDSGICRDCAFRAATHFKIDRTFGKVTKAPAEPVISGPNIAWRAARAAMRTA